MPAADPSTKFSFTEASIRDWKPPQSGRVRLRDAACPGLCLYVSPEVKNAGGTVTNHPKIFYYYAKANGRPVEVRLGVWPSMTVEAARKKAKQEIAPNPKAARDAQRAQTQAHTLADAWVALLAHPWRRDGKAPLRASTLRSYAASWNHLRPRLGSRLVTEITGDDVKTVQMHLLRTLGPAQARQALALLVVLLGGRMPRDANGRAIGKPRLEPRRRFMDAAELGALLRGLEAEPQIWRVFWMCCLLAPLRRGNIASARWADLNLDAPARWIVSSADAKGGKLLAMPIAEPLARILRDWKAQNPTSPWVFPVGLTAGRPVEGEPTHIVSVQHAWARALLFAEAVRLCDAIGPREGKTGAERFAIFLSDLDEMRIASWRVARQRQAMARDGSPLHRMVGLLRDRAKALDIDPAPLAVRNLKPHDLRRTAASWAVQSGASLAVVAASLGHADTRVTEAHYGHLSDDPVRRMLADNAGRLLGTIAPADGKQ